MGRGGGLAAAVGPSLGAFVVDAAGWPWAFYINVPLGALSLRGARLLQESVRPEPRRRLDGVGMALLILGVGAVALAIVQSESPAWSAGELWVAAAVGAGALAASWPGPASRRSRWWIWRCSSIAAIATRIWRR